MSDKMMGYDAPHVNLIQKILNLESELTTLKNELDKCHKEIDKVIDNRNVGMCCSDSSLSFRIAELVSYFITLQSENIRLEESLRWIPVTEKLPENKLGVASEHVEVVYTAFDEDTGELSPYYFRKEAQYWYNNGYWEYDYKNYKPRSFDEVGFRVVFWRYPIPLPD